jgi:hypothetical protein
MKSDQVLRYNRIFLISPDLEKMEQIIAAGVVAPAVEQNLLLAGHTVVWVEADIDTLDHLPDKCLALAEVLDIPPGRVD